MILDEAEKVSTSACETSKWRLLTCEPKSDWIRKPERFRQTSSVACVGERWTHWISQVWTPTTSHSVKSGSRKTKIDESAK
jgi:hypothetical protein